LPAQSPIADNSFLIEEAYNQEARVVQHIGVFQRGRDGSWAYGFTQEWPFFSPSHQVSFTVPVLEDARGQPRLCDVLLNYRYQLVGGDRPVAVAPRVSLQLPTGDPSRDVGDGALGVQANLPVSVRAGRHLVTHWNAGVTWVPRAAAASGDRAAAAAVSLGASAVWLARPRFNVLLELSWARAENVIGPDATATSEELLLAPGVRWAHDFANGLQIVPGLAYAAGVGPTRGADAVILYLSLEHGF
jgi:hypothetical protein